MFHAVGVLGSCARKCDYRTPTRNARGYEHERIVCVLVYVARSRARSAHPEYLIQYMLQNRSTSFLRNHFQSEAQQTDLTQCRILTITK